MSEGGARVGIGLGSNQGDRLEHLNAAITWLGTLGETPVRCSRVYETEPVDCPPGSPSFLNAVCEVTTSREPLELLHEMRAFERKRGRSGSYARHSPRPLDLDLLYVGPKIIQMVELTLPHPRLHQRRFVLQPLCDIDPELVLPGLGLSVRALLGQLSDDDGMKLFTIR